MRITGPTSIPAAAGGDAPGPLQSLGRHGQRRLVVSPSFGAAAQRSRRERSHAHEAEDEQLDRVVASTV